MSSGTSHSGNARPSRSRLLIIVILIILAGGLAVIAIGLRAGWFKSEEEQVLSTFTVAEPGPLTISVTESGSIRSKDQVVIKSEVEGTTTILSLVPEGTQVKKDDLLIELDASKLQDNLVEQQIRVQNSEAAFVRARENLEVSKNQAKADISKAELDIRFAREDLIMYNDGEYPKQLKELEAKIALAQEEVQRAQQTLEGSQVLYEEKYISQNELQADELAAKKAELDLELAREALDLVKKYTHQRRVDELEAEVDQLEMALDRVKRKASADLVQAEAELRAKKAELAQQQDKLTKNEEQIKKTRIHAPRDGLVVYASSTQFSWRGNTDPLAEGQQVRERQELIHLPATDQMMVQVKVPEAKLQLMRKGLRARITIDALPGREYSGRVTKIAPLPDATSIFLNPDLKVYDTEVLLDGSDEAIRTGMTCTVEILAARYEEALSIPLHAVMRRGRQPIVYTRQADNSFALHPVEIGLDDNRLIHITKGLQPGDVVLLNPPMDGAAASQPDGPAYEPDEQQEPATVASAGPAQDNDRESPAPPGGGDQAAVGRERREQLTPEQREAFRKRRTQQAGSEGGPQ